MKSFRLFNSKGEFVVEFLVRFVRWKVNAIEARRKKEQKIIKDKIKNNFMTGQKVATNARSSNRRCSRYKN